MSPPTTFRHFLSGPNTISKPICCMILAQSKAQQPTLVSLHFQSLGMEQNVTNQSTHRIFCTLAKCDVVSYSPSRELHGPNKTKTYNMRSYKQQEPKKKFIYMKVNIMYIIFFFIKKKKQQQKRGSGLIHIWPNYNLESVACIKCHVKHGLDSCCFTVRGTTN